MAVYKITALLQSQQTQHLVCKIPHQRRIVYTATTDHQTTEDTTHQLLDRLVDTRRPSYATRSRPVPTQWRRLALARC